MLSLLTVAVDPHSSLNELNTIIEQQEEFLGAPLVTIGNDGDQTLLSFDGSGEQPDRHAFLRIGGAPTNIRPLAWGKVFIGGELKDVVALRRDRGM